MSPRPMWVILGQPKLRRRDFFELMIEGDATHDTQMYYGERIGWAKLIEAGTPAQAVSR